MGRVCAVFQRERESWELKRLEEQAEAEAEDHLSFHPNWVKQAWWLTTRAAGKNKFEIQNESRPRKLRY